MRPIEFTDKERGRHYIARYQPALSNNDYTQHHVYYVQTNEEEYSRCKFMIEHFIAHILCYGKDTVWSYGLWLVRNNVNPSMVNALHPYYTLKYDEDTDTFKVTIVIPYDD